MALDSLCVRLRSRSTSSFPACAIEKCFSRVELFDCRGCDIVADFSSEFDNAALKY